jgi:uncharacterized protein (TIGR02147 family)
MEVYLYEDYRQFLKDCFLERKKKEPGFTHRRLAAAGGIANPGFFNEVVKGRRKLTDEAADKLAAAFALKDNEAEFFKLLVAHNQSDDPEEKEELFRKMGFRRSRSAFARTHPAAVRYYQDSSYALVRSALQILDFRGEWERLARFLRPALPVPLVKRCVRDLCEWGLVKQGRDGRYAVTNAYLEPGPGMNEALKRLHREWIQQAATTLDDYPVTERHVSSAMIGVSDRVFRDMLRRIDAFRNELLEMVKADPKTPERLVQINIQAFPKSVLLP